jgi:hypothetical protein
VIAGGRSFETDASFLLVEEVIENPNVVKVALYH